MKSPRLTRVLGATLVAACVFALSPAVSAQTAGTYASSGVTKLHQGDYDGANGDFSKALELNSSHLGAHVGRGTALTNLGNFDGAISDFNEALKLKPGFAEAYLGRGTAEFLQGNFDASILDLTKVIELKPDAQEAFYLRGLARAEQTNVQGAQEDFAKALTLKGGGDNAADYIQLYNALFGLRSGNAVDEKLKEPATMSTAWTKSLGWFLTQKMPEAKLLNFAATGGGEDKARQQGEALYFAGVLKLLGGDKVNAKDYFQKSFNVSGGATLVHRLARTELDHS